MLELKLPAYTRQGTKSRAQLEAEVAKERYEDRLAELEAKQEGCVPPQPELLVFSKIRLSCHWQELHTGAAEVPVVLRSGL